MWDVLSWLFFIVFISGLIIVAGLLLRGYLSGAGGANPFSTPLFQPKPDKRLDIVEQTNLDGRRRLVLIRRDNIEHLIMTGGPVDVLVETGIDTRRELRAASEPNVRPTESRSKFSRAPRPLNAAANE